MVEHNRFGIFNLLAGLKSQIIGSTGHFPRFLEKCVPGRDGGKVRPDFKKMMTND
jgi:hypothetical protein